MSETRLCPSAPCQEGNALLGVVGEDGRVRHLLPVIPLTSEFDARAVTADVSPTKRFRFSGTCVTDGCAQWDGGRCTVVDRRVDAVAGPTPDSVTGSVAGSPASGPLPPCGIRGRCRWFGQQGAAACRVCPEVVTDTRREVGPACPPRGLT